MHEEGWIFFTGRLATVTRGEDPGPMTPAPRGKTTNAGSPAQQAAPPCGRGRVAPPRTQELKRGLHTYNYHRPHLAHTQGGHPSPS
jgi:hypothetical protein